MGLGAAVVAAIVMSGMTSAVGTGAPSAKATKSAIKVGWIGTTSGINADSGQSSREASSCGPSGSMRMAALRATRST